MSLEPFHLERWFAQHEFSTPILLGASDCETVSVGELLDLEPDARRQFDALRLGYTHSEGGIAVRTAIADSYGEGIDAEDILVHGAGVEVITTLCLALLKQGERALVQTPCYQVLRTAPVLAGAEVDLLQTRSADRWVVDPEVVEAALRPTTRLVALNSPHNPTGTVIDREALERIADLCADRGITLLVDEAYRGTRYEGPIDEWSAAELGPHVVTLGLVSKGYGLPGLRLGWLVASDPEIREAVELVKDYTTICAPAPSEFLAEIGLRNRATLLGRTRERLRAHLGLLREVMNRHEHLFDWVPPTAGPITFPVLRGEDAAGAGLRFAERLREEAGVLVIPGTLFDAQEPAIRIGFGRANFPEGLERFDHWLSTSR